MSAGRARVASLFATPVLTESWADADRFNPSLREAILARRAAVRGVTFSNVAGWQSEPDMTDWGGPAARALVDHLIARCDEATVDVAADGQRRFAWRGEMWANVNPPGASNQTHCHPGAYWSAVYYVDDGGAGPSGSDQGGELVLLDPRVPMVRMRTPDLRYRRSDGSFDNQEAWIRPRVGQIILFPSWLMHSVRPHGGPGDRLSIAINLVVERRAPMR